ncbi:hypothetical protein AB0904_07015 [Streptomyces sp. NPDC006684]|uniref:hypothetical protein n=1 Tax=Streptomyces sp. NPDC006684 TaxID=3154477 RepID=UPI003453AC3B
MHYRILEGSEGEMAAEEPFRLTGTSALHPSRRAIAFEGQTIDIRVVPRAFRLRAVEHGKEAGYRGPGGEWNLPHPTDRTVMAVCLFEWAGLEAVLSTPLLRDL